VLPPSPLAGEGKGEGDNGLLQEPQRLRYFLLKEISSISGKIYCKGKKYMGKYK
jgi:hypothetical protein